MSVTVFTKLCDEFRAAAGLPRLEVLTTPSGVACFFVNVDGLEIQVNLLPQQPAVVQLMAGVGTAGEYHPSAACKLAEVNAWLLAEDDAAVICRMPATSEYVMAMALPLDAELSAADLMSRMQYLASTIASIRSELAASAVLDSVLPAHADVA